jgi:hypothetical protein
MVALRGRGARIPPGSDGEPDDATRLGRARRGRASWLLIGVTVVVAAPLVVALLAVRRPTWYPLFEMAMTELKVRDVASANPPLVGLSGRIGTPPNSGNHPGPLAYWFMWPVYRLFGASSWGLVAASVSVHITALASALWIAGRRGGVTLLLGTAAVLAVLVHALGTAVFIEAWNPYLPVLWWFVFLLGLWSVACGDVRLTPLTVFAGSLCAQTHLPYLVMTVALSAGVAAVAVTLALLRRRHPEASAAVGSADRATTLRWLVGAAGLGLLLWLPPLVDQVVNDPGNIRILVEHFSTSNEETIGLATGGTLLLERLNPVALLAGDTQIKGWTPGLPVLPGVLLLAAWAGAVVVSWHRRQTSLLRLHGVLAAAMVLGAVTASRIFGGTWNYLVLWMWPVGALVATATVWSWGSLLSERLPTGRRVPATRAGMVVAVGVVAGWAALGVADATRAEVEELVRSAQVGELAPPTAAALVDRPVEDRYLVTWTDPTHFGIQGSGLLLELERRGFDVVVEPSKAHSMGDHRVAERHEVDAVVHLAVGPAIDHLRADPAAVELAATDQAPALVAERQRLVDEVVTGLRAAGLDDLADQVLEQPVAAGSDPRFPIELRRSLDAAANIGYPVAVFLIGQPGSSRS